MPPVALTTATAPVRITQAVPQPAETFTDGFAPASLTTRPVLRLVGSEPVGSSEAAEEVVHGWGGPSTCSCRPCAMARHPAAMPRLRVVD
ncbi:hypothetical protein [Frankia sp. EAN1pec]|uniref:hypothetical protein n=1 Tax=Parafrankia sp. (strain EAN1pec) TaxID=298653 RepID=UPI00059CEE88